MNPKILCTKCSGEIRPSDKFCASCGAVVEWGPIEKNAPPESPSSLLTKPQKQSGSTIRCSLCGYQNSAGSTHCVSCGAALPGAPKSQPKERSKTPEALGGKPSPLTMLQSWKVYAGVAVILIIVVIAFKMMGPNNKGDDRQMQEQAGAPKDAHQNQALMAELATLDKAVQDHPDDPSTLLQYANRLQDAKFLRKAVETYKKYLALRPVDVNATVDLGVTYYELANADTLSRVDDLDLAQTKFEEALKLNPKHQLALFNLGVVNLMRGDLMTATEWFKKTIAVDSTSETGKRASMLVHQHSFTQNPSQ